jgi:hypothetical protein
MRKKYTHMIISGCGGSGNRFLTSIFNYLFDNVPLPLINKLTGSAHNDVPNLFAWYLTETATKLASVLPGVIPVNIPTHLIESQYTRTIHQNLAIEKYISDNFLTFDNDLKNSILAIYETQLTNTPPQLFCLRTHILSRNLLDAISDQVKLNLYIISIVPDTISAIACMRVYNKVKNGGIAPSQALSTYQKYLLNPILHNFHNAAFPDFPFSLIQNKDRNGIMQFVTQTLSTFGIIMTPPQISIVDHYIDEYLNAQLL